MNNIKVESFVTGNAALFDVVCQNPELRMVPIEHVETVRSGLHQRGYTFRIRYRGPHRPQHDTLKRDARAFTVYIYNNIL